MDGVVQVIRRVGDVVTGKSRVAAEFATPARQAARVAAELGNRMRHEDKKTVQAYSDRDVDLHNKVVFSV